MHKSFWGVYLLFFVGICGISCADCDDSVSTFCSQHPELVAEMFDQFDLTKPEFSVVQQALSEGETVQACYALLAYYQTSAAGAWLRKPSVSADQGAVSPETLKLADDVLDHDTFVILNTRARIPRTTGGGLDWRWLGPNNDSEWAWLLNRLGYMDALLRIYQQTGDVKYVERIDADIKDWVLNSPYNGKPDNPQWRGLEVAFRANAFVRVFYQLQGVEAFSDVARLLILSTLDNHANFLKTYHQGGGNWIVTEMRGMAIIGAGWPELKNASLYLDYAIQHAGPQLEKQVLADGAHSELTAHYHKATLNSFSPIFTFVRHAGCELDPNYDTCVEKMWNYLVMTLRPNGLSLLNSDSDLNNLQGYIKTGIDIYDRPDWLYVITNGHEGIKPEGEASVFFPWAGQLISRSGWDEKAHWSFFDLGPYGATGHRHMDKLHFSADAYGRNILVDSGRFAYFGQIAEQYRGYAVGTSSHNVVTIAGQDQKMGKRLNKTAQTDDCEITPAYDAAKGTVTSGYTHTEGLARNTRLVRYERGKYWIIVDRFETDRPRSIEAYWHYHPDCTVVREGLEVTSNDSGKGNIRIVPAGSVDWELNIVKGRLTPTVQGWYSEKYGQYEPNSTAVYHAEIPGETVFAWLLVPGLGTPEAMQAEIVASVNDSVTVKITESDGNVNTVVMKY